MVGCRFSAGVLVLSCCYCSCRAGVQQAACRAGAWDVGVESGSTAGGAGARIAAVMAGCPVARGVVLPALETIVAGARVRACVLRARVVFEV